MDNIDKYLPSWRRGSYDLPAMERTSVIYRGAWRVPEMVKHIVRHAAPKHSQSRVWVWAVRLLYATLLEQGRIPPMDGVGEGTLTEPF